MYDVNGDGRITHAGMLQIVTAIYKMVGEVTRMPADEDTPEKRVNKIFAAMDKNSDDVLTFDEFKEGSKNNPSIISALQLYDGLL